MHVTVLGITGSVGGPVARAFLAAGHTVTALARDPSRVPSAPGLEVLAGDALRAEDLDRALQGADLVFHGLNLPYEHWDPGMVDLTRAVIAAAERAGATVLFPGNVYVFAPDTAPLDEAAPQQPPTRKGRLRQRLEAMLAASDVPTVVLRSGDYFGAGVGGDSSWMHHLTKDVPGGGGMYVPGPLDVPHCWAYLPDLATTFVRLAERRAELPRHAVFHFAGHTADGQALVDAVRAAAGDPDRRVRRFPWMWLQLGRPFLPWVRELFEMRYLWQEPLVLDGAALHRTLGDVPHTPWPEAVATTLGATAPR